MEKTIGILGGMGPLATADLFRKITLLTDAARDNDHIRVYIDSNARIPDRTAAILSGGKDPVPEMASALRSLEAASRARRGLFHPRLHRASHRRRHAAAGRPVRRSDGGARQGGHPLLRLSREGIIAVFPDPARCAGPFLCFSCKSQVAILFKFPCPFLSLLTNLHKAKTIFIFFFTCFSQHAIIFLLIFISNFG